MGNMRLSVWLHVLVASWCVACAFACSIPQMGSEFSIIGGEGGWWSGDGRYNFTIGEDGEYGYVLEDVWNSHRQSDDAPTRDKRETLVWRAPGGETIATFQRVAPSQGWFGWLFGSNPEGFKDLTEGLLIECGQKASFFVGYSAAEPGWFSKNPGHFKVLPFDQVGDNTMTIAATNESNAKRGGGSDYLLEVMEDEVEKSADCSDRDPEYCFKAAMSAMCDHQWFPLLGREPQCGDAATVADCCKLSCEDLTEPKTDGCITSSVLGDKPVATLKLAKSRFSSEHGYDEWEVTRGESGPGSDPRVLIALATMKTAGRKNCDWLGLNCDDKSVGQQNRYLFSIFGSGGNLAIFVVCAVVCTCMFNAFQRR